MSEIRLYGEAHSDDDMPLAYLRILGHARDNGIKTCFIEAPTHAQKIVDRHVAVLSEDPVSCMAHMIEDHKTADRFRRHIINRMFLCALSAHMGVRLVCVDSAPRGVMDIFKAAQNNPDLRGADFKTILERTPLDEIAENRNCSLEEAARLRDQLKAELEDGTFYDKRKKDTGERIAADPSIAAAIADQAKDSPAIVIYGKDHFDPERPDSILNTLPPLTASKVVVFDVSSGHVTRLGSPERNSMADRPLAEKTLA